MSFVRLLHREIQLSLRQAGDFAAGLTFFLLPPFLFALGSGVGALFDVTQSLAMILLTFMLALIAGMDRMLRGDWQSGWFDIVILRTPQLILSVWAKIIAFILLTGVPMILIAPLILKFLYAQNFGFIDLYKTSPILLLFAANLSILGMMIGALSLSARLAPILIFTLLLPLSVPLFIFTIAATTAILQGQNWFSAVSVLLAFFMVSAMVCPIVTVYIIKNLD
jgi:heme exporter protein B